MWEPQLLTTLRASKACRGENFTLPFYLYGLFNATFNISVNIALKGERFVNYEFSRFLKDMVVVLIWCVSDLKFFLR
jgi:hypothetical protein